MENWLFWLLLIILLIVVEVSTINLVSIWFIASGVISLLLSLFLDNLYIEFAVFVFLGLFFLLITRPIIKKYIDPKKVYTNLDRVIEMPGIVTQKIEKNKVGEVKVDGKRWSAIACEEIEMNTEIIVEKIDGVKLIVRKKEK